MGDVILVIRVLPDSPESIEKVRAGLEALKPERLEEESIAFGMKAFKFTKMVPDTGGSVQEDLENQIRAIPGVSDLEVLMASRSL
jgi:translation elongation factor EF-1beta